MKPTRVKSEAPAGAESAVHSTDRGHPTGRTRKRAFRPAMTALLIVVGVIALLPVLWMASGSLKSVNEILQYPPSLLPEVFRWENYARVFQLQPFGRQMLNSFFIMAAVTLATVVVSAMAGYAFARERIRGSSIIFIVLLTGIFLPPETTIVPLFQTASKLGWLDTAYPLIFFTVFLTTTPLATFIMRQAFLALPGEFKQAGRLDGAGNWRIFLQIYLPMVRPTIAAVVVVTAWTSWNQYIEPLVYLRSPENFTVPLGLTMYNDPFAGPLYHVQMSATTLSVLPVLLLFIFAQKHVVAGLTAGGLK